MEPKSLKSICEKVIFLNINNTKKLKDLPKEGLKERTLLTVVREYQKKIRDKAAKYSFFLNFSKNIQIFMMIVGDIVCFVLQRRRIKNNVKNDKKICDEMIKNEIKTKKYLINNDFDVLKGFREFLHELNKSLVFKLSKKYERYTLVGLMKMNEEMEGIKMFLNRANKIWLQKTLIKNFIYVCGLENISSLELDRAIRKSLSFRHLTTYLIDDLYLISR